VQRTRPGYRRKYAVRLRSDVSDLLNAVSMIDGRLFDKLERLARLIRGGSLPFGGIQLVVCGDFFQLPPVPESLSSGQKIPIKFTFEAESWERCIPRVVSLSKVFRQKEGGEFRLSLLLV
jgi:ATP-dependent DNA helicase PIF1